MVSGEFQTEIEIEMGDERRKNKINTWLYFGLFVYLQLIL